MQLPGRVWRYRDVKVDVADDVTESVLRKGTMILIDYSRISFTT